MWVIKFDEVTKQHRTRVPGDGSLRRRISTFRRGDRGSRRSNAPALDRVSFEIEQGSAVALIGANGAGKTTALRLVSRIIPPTKGRVHIRGRVGALLEVGSSVHPELSGRENVWLYGSIIGIPRAEIRRRFDDIVGFSEIEQAIDRQAKFYSSGMQLRLGFAIATFLEPQVLLVDESLATADLNFQLKCIDRMSALVKEGTSLVFVSHEMAAVQALCGRGLLLERGRLVHDADVNTTLTEYRRRLALQRAGVHGRVPHAARIVELVCIDDHGDSAEHVASGGDVTIRIRLELDHAGPAPAVTLRLTDPYFGDLFECSSSADGVVATLEPGVHELRCRLAGLPLRQRSYTVTAELAAGGDDESGSATFSVVDADSGSPALASLLSAGGPLRIDRRWGWEPS